MYIANFSLIIFSCALSLGIFGTSAPPSGLLVREMWDVGDAVVTTRKTMWLSERRLKLWSFYFGFHIPCNIS